MYLEAHRDRDKYPQPSPAPEPLPRPGDTAPAAPDPASAYDTSHIPAIEPAQLGDWLST